MFEAPIHLVNCLFVLTSEDAGYNAVGFHPDQFVTVKPKACPDFFFERTIEIDHRFKMKISSFNWCTGKSSSHPLKVASSW